MILVPDVPKAKPLPQLPAYDAQLEREQDKDPLTIPFDGVYWFYRFPNQRPPDDSVTLHGTPDDIRFRSAGHVTLRMEARQNLSREIETARLSRIQMAIRNTEDEPSHLRAELILSNASAPGEPLESWGTQNIESSPERQTIAFATPAYPLLAQFDAITVRILRTGILTTESARISIDRFVLIPRGR
ncbi:MAG TPA: hypothetical protein VKS01_05200 [Bryobacteraceae bacterium]|nr:hypothetical protein [Bryobacteraceae bacterium]